MLNLRPLIKQLSIQTKGAGLVPFDLESNITSEFGWAQNRVVDAVEDQYNAGKPVRVIVLKARQLGISTISEAILFNWCFIHPGTNGLVIAHEAPVSQELFEKTRLFWETWPFRQFYHPRSFTARSIHWAETRSKLRIATAANVKSGRGFTIQAVHGSECAYYPAPEELMGGLNQSIPYQHGSIVILESTANGTGNWWHREWQRAEAGESEYVPLFFPWYEHNEYQMHTSLSTLLELDPYERWLIKLGATYENIQWRRWAIPNKAHGDENYFMQEYPATPDEAFIASGHHIFSRQGLKEAFHDKGCSCNGGAKGFLIDDPHSKNGVRWVRDISGNFTIFKAPHPKDTRQDRYFVAGDPSASVTGDPACIQVINRQTFEQVAVWHGQIDPISFADHMIRIGKFYNMAMLCPEVEGGGYGTIGVLMSKNYPNIWQHRFADRSPGKLSVTYGWLTNFQRKHQAIGNLQRLFLDRSIHLHDKETYNQLLDYVQLSQIEMGNASSDGHDDAVMALAIAITASMYEGPFIERADGMVASRTLNDVAQLMWDNQDTMPDIYETTGW